MLYKTIRFCILNIETIYNAKVKFKQNFGLTSLITI